MSTVNRMGVQTTAHNDFVGDVQQLQKLKQSAGMQTKEGLAVVAKEFESMYLKMMLDSMRASEKIWSKDNPFSSREQDMFRDMLDGQLSKDLSSSGSLGLADILIRQLSPFMDDANEPKSDQMNTDQVSPPEALKANQSLLPARPQISQPLELNFLEQNQSLKSQEPDSDSPNADFLNETASLSDSINIQSIAGKPDAFIEAMLPIAQKSADRLGVDPRLLVAQAALETGWGQSLARDGHGFNLFGIKAGQSWSGQQTVHPTHEIYNQQIVRERSAFRSYGSLEESFDDYVALIQQRYSGALDVGTNPSAYMQTLAQNGYATDPAYAQKVISIYESQRLSSGSAPLTVNAPDQQLPSPKITPTLAFNKSQASEDPRLKIW